jgi:hypothetical protein
MKRLSYLQRAARQFGVTPLLVPPRRDMRGGSRGAMIAGELRPMPAVTGAAVSKRRSNDRATRETTQRTNDDDTTATRPVAATSTTTSSFAVRGSTLGHQERSDGPERAARREPSTTVTAKAIPRSPERDAGPTQRPDDDNVSSSDPGALAFRHPENRKGVGPTEPGAPSTSAIAEAKGHPARSEESVRAAERDVTPRPSKPHATAEAPVNRRADAAHDDTVPSIAADTLPIVPRVVAPRAPAPSVEANEERDVAVRIGSIDVRVDPPSRPPETRRSDSPLARGFASRYGLRQG